VSVSTCLSCHARLERVPSHLATHCSIRICISGLGSVAFPVLLTWRLHQQQLLGRFNPRVMVNRAVAFLLHSGPVTGEERWEEASGYSPSTLAVIISAFICAASFARTEQDSGTAAFLESYADFLRAHVEEWTVTTQGSLVQGLPRYFVRLNPAKPGEVAAPGALDKAELKLTSQPPGCPQSYPARDIIDAGFCNWCGTEFSPRMTR
jgi:glucoamylase